MNFKEISETLGLEESEYIEMLKIFLESGKADIKKLEKAVAENNPQKAHEASHSFKGSVGSLRLSTLFEISREIDNRCREGKLDGVSVRLKQLQHEFKAVSEEIRAAL